MNLLSKSACLTRRKQIPVLCTRCGEDIKIVPTGLLTRREGEVLRLIAGGLSSKGIAVQLGISTNTVNWHTHTIFSKLDSYNRNQAVYRALKMGILI